MAIEFLNHINLNDSQLQNAKLHVTSSAPTAAAGQIYVDSGDDNKLKYHNGTEFLTLGTATGDITSVTFTTDSGGGATATDSSGDAAFSLLGGNGIGITNSGATITAAIDAAQTTITSVYNTGLKVGYGASHANIDFSTDNAIIFDIDGTQQIKLTDGVLAPITDDDIDLGSSSKQFKNGYFDGTLEADAITVGGTALNTVIAGVTVTNASTAAVATTVTITDNESTNENNALIFTAGGDVDGGNLGLESDGTLTYNPSTGKVTATGFIGTLTGNVTGNASGSSGSCTGNAATATALETSRNINGVAFDGTGNITVTAAGSTLSDTVTVAKGGTGQTSLNSNGVLVGNGTSGITSSTNLSFDDTDLTLASTGKMEFRDSNSYIHSNAANDIEVVATTITLDAGSDIQLEGNTTVTGNFSITGTLNVDGTTTTVDSTTVAIADSMLKLAKDQGTSADDVDFGFYGQYGVGGTAKYAGIFRDQSASGDPFVFFDSLQAEPGATVNTSGTGYDLADISAGAITAADGFTGDIAGDLTGTVATATQGTIDHDSLANFVANEHIDHSSVSITAGDGLTGGGTIASTRTVAVGAGTGITVNANDVAVAAAQTSITSIYATDLILGEDSQTAIDFGTANEIDFKVDNAARLTLTASALYPVTDNQIDLGTSSLEFKDAYFDGTVTSDAFAGPLTGNVTGNVSGSSGSCTGNAATATALESARNIGGVSFDGTGNINLPGVNTSGNQDTSGNAATATILAAGAIGAVKVYELDNSASGVAADQAGSDSTVFTITHGMGASRFYKVEVVKDSGNYDTVYTDVTRPSDTTIVITFGSAVANGAYRAMITRMA